MNQIATLVYDYDLLLNKGDIMQVVGEGGLPELIIVCPNCGQKSSGRHRYNPDTVSLTPSIVHNVKNDEGVEQCGYHGFLTNGIFTEC